MLDQSVTNGGDARATPRRRHRRPLPQRGPGPGADGGQVTLLVGVVVVFALVAVVALGRLGAAAVRSARSQAAADAAALAALHAGVAGARSVASVNGAEVVAVRIEPGWAQVVVTRQGVNATATAAMVEDTSGP